MTTPEELLRQARLATEQAEKAKNEFLANISHELKTPLNIVLGMLALTLEDETLGEEPRGNLTLAKEAADRLFAILGDLITLSHLEGGRLTGDTAPFRPGVLLSGLLRRFADLARAKNVDLTAEAGETDEAMLEGGYNLILLALEKLVDNAVKFVDEGRGRVSLRAVVEEGGADGPWLVCGVRDNGPGLSADLWEAQELFLQGDGSMVRRHGGLGLGLRLARKLAAALGGRLSLHSRPEGGADFHLRVPVKISTL